MRLLASAHPISAPYRVEHNTIIVKNWHDGDLGISLQSEETPPPPQPNPRVFNGDQRAKIIGIEIDTDVKPEDPRYNTYKWSATTWSTSGDLIGGVEEEGFNDVIYGSALDNKEGMRIARHNGKIDVIGCNMAA